MTKELLINYERCLGCRSCELACAIAHTGSKSLFGAVLGGEKPLKRIFVDQAGENKIPLNCRHCEDAPCIDACISGAMHRDEGGVVTNEGGDAPCTGCWMCVMVCPYGVIRSGVDERKAVKCDRGCRDGKGIPACVNSCPTGALKYETVDAHASVKRLDFLHRAVKSSLTSSDGTA